MQIRKKKSWKIECSHLVIVNGSIVLTRFDMWCSSQQFVNVSKPSYGACSNFYNKKLSNYHWNRIFLKFFFCVCLEQTRNNNLERYTERERKSKINISWESFSSYSPLILPTIEMLFLFLSLHGVVHSLSHFVIIRILHG